MGKTITLFIQHWKGFSTETGKLERPFVISYSGNTESKGCRFKIQVRQSTASTLCSRSHCHRIMNTKAHVSLKKRGKFTVYGCGEESSRHNKQPQQINEDTTHCLGKLISRRREWRKDHICLVLLLLP